MAGWGRGEYLINVGYWYSRKIESSTVLITIGQQQGQHLLFQNPEKLNGIQRYWQPHNYLLENYLMANKPNNTVLYHGTTFNGVNRTTMYLFRTDFRPYLTEPISIEFYTLSRLFRIPRPKTLHKSSPCWS